MDNNSAEFFKELLSQLPGDVAVFDRKYRYVFVNAPAIKDDKVREWIIGKTDYEYCEMKKISSDIAESRRAIFKQIEKDLKEVEFEERIVDKYGNVKYHLRRTKPFFNKQGEFTHFLGYGIDVTQERVLSKKLEESTNFVTKVIDSSPHLIFVKDIEGRFLMVNKAVCDLFGLSKEELLFQSNADVHSYKEEVREFNRVDQEVITQNKALRIEEAFTKQNGEVAYYDTIKVPLESLGLMNNVLGISTDVTDRKRKEQMLEISEQRMIIAQKLMKTGNWDINYVTREVNWSLGMYEIWERNPLIGPPKLEDGLIIFHPDDFKRISDIVNEISKEEDNIEFNYRIIVPSGVKKVRTVAKASFDEVGEQVRLFGTVIDVTEQIHTEESLRLNQYRLNEAQELAKLGSWQLDLISGETSWSIGTYIIWDREQTLPPPSMQEVLESIDEEDRQFVSEAISNSIKDKSDFNIEYGITTSIGRKKIINGRGIVQLDAEGIQVSLFGTVLDITDRKKVEEELLAAKIQAQDSIRTKEYFLANIGHELRTPLNGILGMARLLQKTEISAIQRSYIDVLNTTAGNLLVIINDILDSAKIESGTLTFDQIIFDPMQVADTAIQVQLYKAEEKDLVLRHLHEGTPMPMVIGDPYRLNQVLLNLLSNAVKFTDSGEVVLIHKVSESNGDFINIEFSIQDTGIGIPIENQSSIFESFMQLNSSSPHQFGGTGLGLSISKNLVEKQGGTIGVKSTPGFGSIFTFTIPYKKAEIVEQPEFKHGLVSADELGPLRVLLAEDNRVNQYITEAMLQDWGFKVDIANNGVEAVDLYTRKEYDIILMDIQMPELNGIEATRLIRAHTDIKKASVPIIALTANTTRQIQRNFVVEGMNDFLVKPFKEETLYKKIAIHILGKDKINSTLKRKFPTRKRPIPIGVRLYNLSLLRNDARNNPEFIKRMLNIFIETIPTIIDKMHEHYENGEMDAISTLAHKIKPTLDGAGIVSLKDSIRNIESYRDKKRTPEQLKVDIDLLQKVISIVTAEFAKELKNLD